MSASTAHVDEGTKALSAFCQTLLFGYWNEISPWNIDITAYNPFILSFLSINGAKELHLGFSNRPLFHPFYKVLPFCYFISKVDKKSNGFIRTTFTFFYQNKVRPHYFQSFQLVLMPYTASKDHFRTSLKLVLKRFFPDSVSIIKIFHTPQPHSTTSFITWIPTASALQSQSGLRSDTLNWLFIALPINGSNDCGALELQIAVFEVLFPHFEVKTQSGSLQTSIFISQLKMKRICFETYWTFE